MRKELVKTTNYERFKLGIKAVERRGAPEASLVLVVGDPGFSKSIVVNRWAVENKAIYLRAKVDWTPAKFMRELATELRIDGARAEIFGRVVAAIGRMQAPIVIDEVQHCLGNGAKTLEAVRDISDLTETIVVLVAGEERVQAKIARYPQISSRIAAVVEFGPATAEDIARSCAELIEPEVAPDLVEEIRRQSGGRMRHVINALAIIEAEGKKSGKKKLALADFAGRALVHDWQERRPRGGRPA